MRRAVSILEIKACAQPRVTIDLRARALGRFEHLVILAEIGAARREYAEELPELVDVGGEG